MTIVMTLLAIAAMVLVDQVVKYWAVTVLAPLGTLPLIPGVVQLTYVENRGAAFSILEDQIWLFVLLAIAVLIAIIYILRKEYIQNTFGKVALIIVASGAIGNVIDRIVHRYVVDMIQLKFFDFPVFNIADIYITVGIVLFAIYYMFMHKEEKKEPEKNAEDE